jgi:hypothetical protein
MTIWGVPPGVGPGGQNLRRPPNFRMARHPFRNTIGAGRQPALRPALARFFGTIFTSLESGRHAPGGLSPKEAKWLIANGR